MVSDRKNSPLSQTTASTIALVGNPNTGKSTVFNALCGTHQVVGNYPGVTVEKKVGRFRLDEVETTLVDLPGIYSLIPRSPDERIAAEALMGRVVGLAKPDLILYVMDATNLKRNLFLFSQVAELGIPMVVVLTMADLLEREGIHLDSAILAHELGVPVVTVTGRNQEQLALMRTTMSETMVRAKPVTTPFPHAPSVDAAISQLKQALPREQHPTDFELRCLLLGFMENEHYPAEVLARAVNQLKPEVKLNIGQEISRRYDWATLIVDRVESRNPGSPVTFSQRLDGLLIHRFWGLLIFVAVMFIVFQSIYTWAVPFMDLIETLFGVLGNAAGSLLANTPILESLVTDGIIGGVGSVVVFLPQILILFFFVAVLEDSGYMARAAFLMDKLMSWTGLNGRAFIPLLSGFACAVPAIMATRVMPDPRARLATILVTPLISCSARLPVYLLLISTFIEPQFGPLWAAFTLFAMHGFGLVLALIIAWILNRNILKVEPMPFVLEMPTYRMPKAHNVLYRTAQAGRKFMVQAGTIIFACSIIIWALSFFPRPQALADQFQARYLPQVEALRQENPADPRIAELLAQRDAELAGAYLEQSYLGRGGKMIQPLFAPLGFDWKISVGVLGAFPAREVIISTLGIVYNLGEVDENSSALADILRNETHSDGSPVYTPLVAITLMIFFALCSQCMSTLATVKRELNSWKWTGFLFSYMTILAYGFSFTVYQVGSLLGF